MGERDCPQCGEAATYQAPDGTFWCASAHYWRIEEIWLICRKCEYAGAQSSFMLSIDGKALLCPNCVAENALHN